MSVLRGGQDADDIRRAFGAPLEGGAADSSRTPTPVAAKTTGAPVPSGRFEFLTERPEKVIPLLFPFKLDDVTYTEYTLRRLNSEQCAEVGAELARTQMMASLYSALTGLPYEAILKMDGDDAEVMEAEAVPFMPARLRRLVTAKAVNLSVKSTQAGESS